MKHKFLPILLPALFALLGFGLGSVVTKLNTESIKTSQPASIQKTSQTKISQTPEKPKEPSTEETNSQTYTVAGGDTLFSISLKFNVTMDELAKLNNIADPNQIKIGQVLKIPAAAGGETISLGKIEIDLEKMKEIQTLVDQGEQPWRLEPIEVVKATAPASYQFTATDEYALKSKDLIKGTAVVEVKKSKDNKIVVYTLNLTQPMTKGEKGIWAIEAIQ